MLPSRYRGRYSLFILLSLLVHFTIVVALFWNSDKQDEQAKTEKTVTVTLKQKEEPKKQEEKLTEAKQQEAKQQEAKQQEAKQQEAKQQEAKKQEAKKQEAKKQEAKKQEAKKQEAKKQEAKKQEAKKQEAKKQEAKKQEAKKQEPEYRPYQSSVDIYSQKKNIDQEFLRKPNDLIKFGSMSVLDDRELKKSVVYTEGLGNRFKKREIEGQKIRKSLSRSQIQLLNNHLVSEAEYIFSFSNPPKKDGNEYFGEVSILLDEQGYISDIALKTPSGNNELDQSFIETIRKAKKLQFPKDPVLRRAMHIYPLTFSFTHEDMVD